MKGKKIFYPGIDMDKTGKHLKEIAASKGYTVKELQELLQLACPQPVYRWFKGKALPSVDHLYVLSKVFGMHMEELLIPNAAYDAPLEKKHQKRWNYYQISFNEMVA